MGYGICWFNPIGQQILYMQGGQEQTTKPIISIAQYRKLRNDYKSKDWQILQRICYLETLCREIVKKELETYDTKKN